MRECVEAGGDQRLNAAREAGVDATLGRQSNELLGIELGGVRGLEYRPLDLFSASGG